MGVAVAVELGQGGRLGLGLGLGIWIGIGPNQTHPTSHPPCITTPPAHLTLARLHTGAQERIRNLMTAQEGFEEQTNALRQEVIEAREGLKKHEAAMNEINETLKASQAATVEAEANTAEAQKLQEAAVQVGRELARLVYLESLPVLRPARGACL